MAYVKDITRQLVSISQFNKGGANKIFAQLKEQAQLIVLKNNKPEAVIISPEKYEEFVGAVEDLQLIALSQQRIDSSRNHTISFEDVLAASGITQEDLDATPMPELE